MNRSIVNRIASLEARAPNVAPPADAFQLLQEIADLMREEGMAEDEIAAELADIKNNPDRPGPYADLADADLDRRIAQLEAERTA